MFTIVLPDETLEIVKKVAVQTGKSYAEIIALGIQNLIEPEKKESVQESKEATKRVVRFGSKQNQ